KGSRAADDDLQYAQLVAAGTLPGELGDPNQQVTHWLVRIANQQHLGAGLDLGVADDLKVLDDLGVAGLARTRIGGAATQLQRRPADVHLDLDAGDRGLLAEVEQDTHAWLEVAEV